MTPRGDDQTTPRGAWERRQLDEARGGAARRCEAAWSEVGAWPDAGRHGGVGAAWPKAGVALRQGRRGRTQEWRGGRAARGT